MIGEGSFQATLGRGATLEQWASWLESCVRDALAPHTSRPDYTPRARRLLLDWSFYSSLVIRELTLRLHNAIVDARTCYFCMGMVFALVLQHPLALYK